MTLWLGAAVLLLTALGFVLVPAWQRHRREHRWPVANLAAGLLLVPFAIGLYLNVTTWSEDAQPDASLPAVADMVAGLADRLQQNPGDVAGWRLLGQSYLALGQYPEALQALREAWQRTPEPDDELRVALGEAEALNDRESLAGEAGALFDAVLQNNPSDPKALWYGGLAALITDQPELARERWSQLLDLDPPETIAQVLRDQLQLLGGPVEAATPQPKPIPAAEGGAIRLMVSVDEAIAAEVVDSASLFIFARSPDGGPPVAVLRQSAATLPGEFRLSDSNAMIPGRSLEDFETLTIVARISPSGQPTEQSGDLFGQISYRPGQDPDVQQLVIDQTVP